MSILIKWNKSRLRNTPPANEHENIPLQQRFDKSFYLFPISTSECSKIFTNLKNTKVDLNAIPITLLKKISTI